MSTAIDKDTLQEAIVDQLKTIYDPEIPVSIYELGLIYEVRISDNANVEIDMTLTSPACPEAQSLPPQVEQAVTLVEGVAGVSVEIVWDPPWGPERMSDEARLTLGL